MPDDATPSAGEERTGPSRPAAGSGSVPSPGAEKTRFEVNEVLWAELQHLGRADAREAAPDLKSVYARIGAFPKEKALSALCLSGGGIRSATFNLGVIQALARMGLIESFDYLSSVSGGGYIAGWLKAWLYRRPLAQVVQELTHPERTPGFRPLAPEPRPLDHLREYSNYLTPRVGLLSADTWAAAALIVRNLILNWLVLLPVLAAVVAVPQAAFVIASASPPSCVDGVTNPLTARWGWLSLYLAVVLASFASATIYHLRRQRAKPPKETTVLLLGVLPLWMSCLALARAALWLCVTSFSSAELWAFFGLWCVGIPLFGWILALASARRVTSVRWTSDLAGIVLSGAVAAVLLFVVTESWLPALKNAPSLYVVFGVPILLGLYLLARALFVAFASLGEGGGARGSRTGQAAEAAPSELAHADREWWARLSGWVLVLATTWTGISALIVLGGFFINQYAMPLADQTLAALGGAAGLLTALLGASPKAKAPTLGESEPSLPARLKGLALAALTPITLACLVLVLAKVNAWTARKITGVDDLLRLTSLSSRLDLPPGLTPDLVFFWFLLVPVSFTLVSWLLGWVVNVNRFSAHGLYRNRLVRAFLGASNPSREPDPFTGFDPRDNIPLHELAGGPSPRPLLVVNATLNLVKSAERLAWQQRKAESFSMTPLFCGNFYEGYRRSREYGGENGITLGTAITISGAAANPSAGYHSSPLVSFLMTLFNVRLGCWLGNTNEHGQAVYCCSGPRHAWMSLFADLLGFTDRNHAYVSLSDGGHFENLAVYEMVLRRCRLIVVSDAGQDPAHSFEDLANLVRKVRIDFGIPIDFERPIRILPANEAGPGLVCAIGEIGYDRVDPGAPPGQLLYLKPTLRAGGAPVPYDVYGYSKASALFPHEPTTDQWFTEAQFESYRALGIHLVGQLGRTEGFVTLDSFFEAVADSLGRVDADDATPGKPTA